MSAANFLNAAALSVIDDVVDSTVAIAAFAALKACSTESVPQMERSAMVRSA